MLHVHTNRRSVFETVTLNSTTQKNVHFSKMTPPHAGIGSEMRQNALSGGERTFFGGKCTGMLRTFFTIDFRFLGNFGPDLEKSLTGFFGSHRLFWLTPAFFSKSQTTNVPCKRRKPGRSPRGEKYFFSLKKSFPEKMTFYFAPGLRPTGAKPCINK